MTLCVESTPYAHHTTCCLTKDCVRLFLKTGKPRQVVFVYCYPRLDVEVSKHMNHLLKAPFCVHPKTGRVCVPIDPATCETFDAFAVPTVAQLLNQVRFVVKRAVGRRPVAPSCAPGSEELVCHSRDASGQGSPWHAWHAFGRGASVVREARNETNERLRFFVFIRDESGACGDERDVLRSSSNVVPRAFF